jgi:hypothetical protein
VGRWLQPPRLSSSGARSRFSRPTVEGPRPTAAAPPAGLGARAEQPPGPARAVATQQPRRSLAASASAGSGSGRRLAHAQPASGSRAARAPAEGMLASISPVIGRRQHRRTGWARKCTQRSLRYSTQPRRSPARRPAAGLFLPAAAASARAATPRAASPPGPAAASLLGRASRRRSGPAGAATAARVISPRLGEGREAMHPRRGGEGGAEGRR